jgi:hypothetical protein
LRWYRLAAAQGDARAQGNLALLAGKGQGVTQGDVRAEWWLFLGLSFLLVVAGILAVRQLVQAYERRASCRPDVENHTRRDPLDEYASEQVELRRELNAAQAAVRHRDAAIASLQGHLAAAEATAKRWERAAAAQAAELQNLQASRPSGGANDDRFRRLRALILKELHPDHAAPGSVDRALRGEVFKSIWPKLEEIDRAS